MIDSCFYIIQNKLTKAEIYDSFPDIIRSVDFDETYSIFMCVIEEMESTWRRDKDLLQNLLYVLEIDIGHQNGRFGKAAIGFTYLLDLT